MLKSELLESLSVKHGFYGVDKTFFSVIDDDDAVVSFLDDWGADELYMPIQVHSNKVASINSRKSADAVVTRRRGAVLAVRTADCAPVLLYDKVSEIIAVAHAGWRGARDGVVENTVARMRLLGANDIVAAIGPCISSASYGVDPVFQKHFDKKYFRTIADKLHFDLPGFVKDALISAGVNQVDTSACVDTFVGESFLSYRRQGPNLLDRNLSFITL